MTGKGHPTDDADREVDPPDAPGIDAGALEEWIAGITKSEETDAEVVRESLIFLYWAFNEMARLTDEPDASGDVVPPTIDFVPSPASEGDGSTADGEKRKALTDDESRIRDLAERLDAIGDDIETVRERFDGSEDEVADGPSAGEFRALAVEFESFKDTTESRHGSLRDRVEEEFGNLRTIIEHLIAAVEEHDDRIERLAEEIYKELEGFRSERRALIDLKRSAQQAGVWTATCEYCGTDIDLALLETPSCPQCERVFDGIDPGGWFGLRTGTLTIERDPTVRRGARGESEPGGDAEEE